MIETVHVANKFEPKILRDGGSKVNVTIARNPEATPEASLAKATTNDESVANDSVVLLCVVLLTGSVVLTRAAHSDVILREPEVFWTCTDSVSVHEARDTNAKATVAL
jgi:hypothetical protein